MQQVPKRRMTVQRKFILETVKNSDIHLTADEIFKLVRKKLPRISMGTVYRNLMIMREMNMIEMVEFSGTQRRFDKNTEPHFHIKCIHCGRIDDFPLETASIFEDIEEKVNDYDVISCKIEILGLCSKCKKNQR